MCEVKDGHNYTADAKRETTVGGWGARVANGTSNGNGRNGAWEWFWRALSVLVIPWSMWISITLVDVKERVAVMEGNRFTSSDGMRVLEELAKRPTRDEIQRNYPPGWLTDRLSHLEEELDKHLGGGP